MPPAPRTIAVVTGSRAEFGLLLPVMRALAAESRLRLRVIVTGVHLSAGTWRDIAGAGLAMDAKVPMQRRGVTGRAADVAALARGVAGLGRVFDKLKPDVVLVLGDRIEALAAASAASVGGIRLAHLHGGDRAEGVADEAMRHAISKLAHLHMAATAQSRQRLVRMGEHPRHVFNVGSPAIDVLRDVMPADAQALRRLGLDPRGRYVIVMQHPVGGTDAQEKKWMLGTLAATAAGCQRLVMAPNSDPGSAGILAACRAAGVMPIAHLPREVFLGLLAGAAALVGNSSAGLIEAAAVRRGGVPVVNIGPRQAGREKPGNVMDCDYGAAAVRSAMRRGMAKPPAVMRHPYGDGHAGEKIARLLAGIDLDAVPVRKHNSY